MAASNNHRLTVTVKPNSGHTLFRYTAKDIDGKVVRGTMEAADYDTLYTQLLAQGLYLQSATRRGAGRKPRTLRPQELSDLCRQLSTLLASGVSLVRALTIISQDEGISAGLRRIYESVLGEVRKGSSLSAALEAQQVFPTLMLGMIRAGEGSGKLDQVAERLAIHYEKAHQMNQQVKSALMYPMILAILAVAVVIVIVTFVLPQFSDLFSTMDSLPGVTLALMAFSNFMVTKWYLMILGVAAAVMVIRTLLRIPAVRLEMDRRKLKMPVFGPLNQVICTARFARTISSLYSSGLPIVTALQTARDTIGNAYIVSQFDDARAGAFASACPPPRDRRRLSAQAGSSIAVGEETGRLDSMLDSIADSMEYDAQQASKRMMTILEPMLIVLMRSWSALSLSQSCRRSSARTARLRVRGTYNLET
ncbi:MAG: type II secretion system F family protein [Butyricicoccus sp.]